MCVPTQLYIDNMYYVKQYNPRQTPRTSIGFDDLSIAYALYDRNYTIQYYSLIITYYYIIL